MLEKHRFKGTMQKIFDTSIFKFLKFILQQVQSTNIVYHAYAMAYVTLFSLVPSLAATFALISLFTPLFGANSELILKTKNFILQNLATGSGEQALKYLQDFLTNTDFTKIGISGFAGMTFTLILLLKQVEVALNRIFNVEKPRALLLRFAFFWTFLTLGTFTLGIAIGSLSGEHLLGAQLSHSPILHTANNFAYAISLFSLFTFLYKVVPNRFVPWKHAAIGGAVASFLFAQAVRFFSMYILYFTKFQAIYGALSALPIFLFWLYVIWFITLFGALITKTILDDLNQGELGFAHHQGCLDSRFLECLLPILILARIYEHFHNSGGPTLTEKEISSYFRIDRSNANQAIQMLVKKGFVAMVQTTNRNTENIPTLLPCFPQRSLNYKSLREAFIGSEKTWLESTTIGRELEPEYLRLVQNFLSGADKQFTHFCDERAE